MKYPAERQSSIRTVPRSGIFAMPTSKIVRGGKIIDFEQSNLHVLNYSVPVLRAMRLAELKEHLHSLPDRPNAIPYRTSYYLEAWGFCVSHGRLEDKLVDDEYEVVINSTLQDGI